MSTNSLTDTLLDIIVPVPPESTQIALRSKALALAEGAKQITVTSPDSHQYAGEVLKAIKIMEKDWESLKRPEVDEKLRVYKADLKEYQEVVTPLESAEGYLKRIILSYEAQQEDLRRKEEARIQAELQKKADADAVAAAQANQIDAAVQAEAEGDTARAEQIISAPLQVAPVYAGTVVLQSPVSKIEGGSRRTKVIVDVRNAKGELVYCSDDEILKKAEIHRTPEFSQIPDQFWVLDTARLRKAADATREQTSIPGVKVRMGATLAVKA